MRKKTLVYLIGLYCLFVIIKSILSYFVVTPTMFNDEYLYAKMARSFFYNLNLYVHGEQLSWGRPLYSIILSVSYLFKDMTNVYLVMKIINALLSSLVIFPAYLLSKEFFGRNKSLLIAILISVLPMNFAFSSYILSENIFYVLFLFSIYFMYKAINEDKLKWAILTGLFIGLCNLSRIQGLALFPILILFLFKRKFRFLFYTIIIALAILAPYYLLNVKYLGLSVSGLLGYDKLIAGETLPFSIVSFGFWCLIYLSCAVLASGIFPFLFKFKKNNLFWIVSLSLIFLVFMGAFFSTSNVAERPVGRYIEAIIPGILILGLSNLKENKKISFLQGLAVFGFILISFKLLESSLLPVNHLMLSHIGIINYFYGRVYSILLIFAIFISFLLIKKLTFKKFVSLCCLFFITISLLCYAINFSNAYTRWYNLDQIQAGLWLDKLDKNPNKLVFIENVDVSELPRRQPLLRAGFWINGEIIFDKLENYKKADYIISINKLDNFKIIKEFGDVKIWVT